MRVVRVHAPGADPRLARSIEDGVRAFNAELDIRLRFLSIGVEEEVVEVADAAAAAEQVTAALSGGDSSGRVADAMLLLGSGPAAVAAATAAARAKVIVLRVGAGRRRGKDADAGLDAERAADRLCGVLLAESEAEATALRTESVEAEIVVVGTPEDPATGARIVRALTRARRRLPC